MAATGVRQEKRNGAESRRSDRTGSVGNQDNRTAINKAKSSPTSLVAPKISPVKPPILRSGQCESKTVTLAGVPIGLTKKPFDLLSLLASDDGRVFSENEIVQQLWPEAPYADSGDVRQCVYMLRKRLDEGLQGGGRCIVNVKGFGYKLDASCIYAVHTEAER